MSRTPFRDPFESAYFAALKRVRMAKRLGCRPEAVVAFAAIADAALRLWNVQEHYRKAREAKKGN